MSNDCVTIGAPVPAAQSTFLAGTRKLVYYGWISFTLDSAAAAYLDMGSGHRYMPRRLDMLHNMEASHGIPIHIGASDYHDHDEITGMGCLGDNVLIDAPTHHAAEVGALKVPAGRVGRPHLGGGQPIRYGNSEYNTPFRHSESIHPHRAVRSSGAPGLQVRAS